MFKISPFYRNDVWFGRYCGHPLTAWTHLLAALAMAVVLHQTPGIDIGWGWLLFGLVPGVWLFITGMFGMMRFTAKVCGLDSKNLFFEESGRSWRVIIFSREGAAAIMINVLLSSTFMWQQARPFDQEDFRRCVRSLDPAAQAVLAKTAKPGMPHKEFWRACVTASRANAPEPVLPGTLEELQAKSH